MTLGNKEIAIRNNLIADLAEALLLISRKFAKQRYFTGRLFLRAQTTPLTIQIESRATTCTARKIHHYVMPVKGLWTFLPHPEERNDRWTPSQGLSSPNVVDASFFSPNVRVVTNADTVSRISLA